MMKIIDADEQASGTVLYLEMNDGKIAAQALPTGLLEHRQGEWDLPADVDPLDVALVEAHYGEKIAHLSPYAEGYEEARELVLSEVRKHRGKFEWGSEQPTPGITKVATKREPLSKARIKLMAHLPPGLREDVAADTKRRVQAHRESAAPEPSSAQLFAERIRQSEEVSAGHARRQQELEAEQHVQSLRDTGLIAGARSVKLAIVDEMINAGGNLA